MAEKDNTIAELRETVEILELKIKKLEQLVKLKDQRIQTLTARMQGGGSGVSPGMTTVPVTGGAPVFNAYDFGTAM